ncbi:GNAT family N-acetyltransferase [Zeaxanthinibacter sp. PT1]|uniref:peptidoglycan bridge formation glycyltransferase FemA/FemB family protein n=1 Tax=Zeaxanthinibacter TaxID=561554 RepID=UPI00234ABDEB|nr:peptidoglycan bridge formation glycyltransferase FemA/FemB family protein [Zeaxanthinibacter sp. PT1]MDC6352765.1 GNAT family N-acetyltransferase [Zeaxanthinibacter sp. PT1]
MIKIIKDKDSWNEIISSFKDADVYHTYDYHHVSKGKDEFPVLIQYIDQEQVIALPLLIRNIEGTNFKDATSVYGYSGPLCRDCGVKKANPSKFKEELDALFIKNNIVSIFSRLHPFISYQTELLSKMGEIVSPGKVVSINLDLPDEEQQQYYNRRLRTYINKCRRTYDVKEVHTESEIMAFIEMYTETMKRVNAKEKYFFDKEYFFNFMKSDFFDKKLLLAFDKESNEIAAGALFIMKNQMVNYHLSGLKEDYLKLNPIKLLLEVVREESTRDGYSFFNLGGGVGNKEDSLFRFKAGYSKDVKDFNLWRYVVNQEIYDELAVNHLKNTNAEQATHYREFFPLYRVELAQTEDDR